MRFCTVAKMIYRILEAGVRVLSRVCGSGARFSKNLMTNLGETYE